MAQPALIPIDRTDGAPRPISARLRSQLVYFMSAPGAAGVPVLAENEYWFAAEEVDRWVEEGVFYLVSPLDTANMTEVEITEEQEAMLFWLDRNQVQHVRAVE